MNQRTGKTGLLSLLLLTLFLFSCGGETTPTAEQHPLSIEPVTAETPLPTALQVETTKQPIYTPLEQPSPASPTTITPAVSVAEATDLSPELFGDLTATPPPIVTPALPFYETVGCIRFSLGSLGNNVQCGYLTVLENRELPEGRQIKLPVVILKAQAPDPAPDPLIYVAPGGGLDALTLVQYYNQTFVAQFRAERDVIIYNQRGAPHAIPELQCPGFERLLYEQSKQVDLSNEQKISEKVEFLRQCAEQLRASGVELEMYSSTANAADLADLITALGLEQANILGVSYGTNVGLALLRDNPGVVRSMILDSVYPPQIAMNSSRALNAYHSFEKLFAACAEDVDCNLAYPDLGAVFYKVVEGLNQAPVGTEVTGWLTYINGGIFAEAIYSMLVSGAAEDVPRAIAAAYDGDFSRIEQYVPDILNAYAPGDQDYISEGVFYSLTCREEVPFDSIDQAVAEAALLPESLAEHFLTLFARWQFALCDAWDIQPAEAIVDEQVTSSVPTLIFAGQFDPITPPEWARQTAETLSNSTVFVFPGQGHGFFDADACAKSLAREFLNDPAAEPRDPCLNALGPIGFH